MAWIRQLSDAEATGQAAETFARVRAESGMGHVANIIRCLSLRPEVMDAVNRLSTRVTFGGSSLTRVEEEMLSTVVSALNHCHY